MSKTERSYRGLLWSLALLGFSLDQAGKYCIFHWLYADPQVSVSEQLPRGVGEHVLIPGVFKLYTQTSLKRADESGLLYRLQTWSGPNLPKVNHGALFGLGQDDESTPGSHNKNRLANSVFALISLIAAGVIAFWSFRPAATRDWVLSAALGLILGGTLGNLYDRLVFNGVRDFLYFHWIEWPVFNIADCCLVCGASLLLVQALWRATPATAPAEAPCPPVAAEAK